MIKDWQIFLTLWNKDYATKALVPAMLMMIGMMLTGWSIFGLMFFVLAFTAFDCLAFTYLSARDQDHTIERVAYRVVQLLVHTVLICFVWYAAGFWAALGSMIAWWFCVCDKLFYVFHKIEYGGEYTWLSNWSVFAVLKKWGIKPYTTELNTVAIIGGAIGLILCLL